MMLKFLVKGQKIEILEREVIASDQIAFVTLKFVFDGDWKKFHKVVQFTQCDETYNRVLGTDGLSCLLPAELHAGAVKLSVFGYDADNTSGLRATTVPVTLHIRASGFVGEDADSPIPPTPDLYTQLLQKIGEVQHGKDGADGKDGKDGLPAKIAPTSERCFSISAVDRFKLHVIHSECDKVLADFARLYTVGTVLRWGFSLGGFWRFGEIYLARFRDFKH